MPSENRIEFTKENLDTYLKEVAREYRRLAGKGMPAELILIGGACAPSLNTPWSWRSPC